MLFSGLPCDLSSCILVDWLDLKAMTRLDSALCSKSGRTSYLFLLKNVCSFLKVDVYCIPKLHFLITRQLRVHHISFDMPSIESRSMIRKTKILEEWIVNMCDSLSRLTMKNMSSECVTVVMESALHVKCIEFNNCVVTDELCATLKQQKFSEISLIGTKVSVLPLNPELKRLKIRFPHFMCNERNIHFASQLIHLRSLELSGDWVTDEILIQFSLHCPNVVHLNTVNYGTSEATMIALMENYRNLQSLLLFLKFGSSGRVLDVVAERHGHSLETLRILSPLYTSHPAVSNLLAACTNLTTLHLFCVDHPTLTAILSHPLKSITTLFIKSDIINADFQNNITNAISDYWTQLRVLGLTDINTSGAYSIDTVLTTCFQLKRVYFRRPQGHDELEHFRNGWPQVQFITNTFPEFDVMAFE